MRKFPMIAEGIKKESLATILEAPQDIEIITKLKRLHNPEYVNAFLKGVEPLASSNGFEWTEQICDGVIAINEAMLAGANTALERGVAAVLGAGFHHAKWGRGDAFCTFNGLALAAQEHKDKTVYVLDCDEHQGDGTKQFINQLQNLWSYSIFGTKMDDEPDLLAGRAEERLVSGWDEYESALWDGLLNIEIVQPHLVLYQAGVDCYKDDGMGQAGLRSSELVERDRIVFEFLRDAGIPVLFVMAGGYSEHAVHHHLQTFRTAVAVYGK